MKGAICITSTVPLIDIRGCFYIRDRTKIIILFAAGELGSLLNIGSISIIFLLQSFNEISVGLLYIDHNDKTNNEL